jgi:hypothetical protein
MEPMTYEQAAGYLEVIRDMIKHENELVNQRLSWMFTLQGLLFGSVSFLWAANVLPTMVLGLVGLLSCVSIGYALARGLGAIKDLLAIAQDYKKSVPSNISLPPTIGSRRKAVEWLIPARLLPWVLGLAWIAILAFRISNARP